MKSQPKMKCRRSKEKITGTFFFFHFFCVFILFLQTLALSFRVYFVDYIHFSRLAFKMENVGITAFENSNENRTGNNTLFFFKKKLRHANVADSIIQTFLIIHINLYPHQIACYFICPKDTQIMLLHKHDGFSGAMVRESVIFNFIFQIREIFMI